MDKMLYEAMIADWYTHVDVLLQWYHEDIYDSKHVVAELQGVNCYMNKLAHTLGFSDDMITSIRDLYVEAIKKL